MSFTDIGYFLGTKKPPGYQKPKKTKKKKSKKRAKSLSSNQRKLFKKTRLRLRRPLLAGKRRR